VTFFISTSIFPKAAFRRFQRGGGFLAGSGDLGHFAFQIRVGVYSMFSQEIQSLCGLLQVMELILIELYKHLKPL